MAFTQKPPGTVFAGDAGAEVDLSSPSDGDAFGGPPGLQGAQGPQGAQGVPVSFEDASSEEASGPLWPPDLQGPVQDFKPSGTFAAHGLVPQPGLNPGSTLYVCEDATFRDPTLKL